jgi:hypothetical protein
MIIKLFNKGSLLKQADMVQLFGLFPECSGGCGQALQDYLKA